MKADLKLKDLKEQSYKAQTQLLSVRLPIRVIEQIDRLADRLNARKTDTVVALLNEGLERLNEKEWPRPGARKVSRQP